MDDFETYRPLLFSLAYRLTGSAADAEDCGQEAYLAYATADLPSDTTMQTFLLSVVARLCLERLEEIRGRREDYLGPWLPEPVLTSEDLHLLTAGGASKESLSLSFLDALDALDPMERAVYLLRAVFSMDEPTVAQVLGLNASDCRDLAERAGARVAERYRPAETGREARQSLVEQFLEAVLRSNEAAVRELLSPEAVYLSDAGGRVVAATRPVSGQDSVARLLLGLLRQAPRGATFSAEEINAGPGLASWAGGELLNVVSFDIAAGRIRTLRALLNPEKLMYLRHQLRVRERDTIGLARRGW